MARSQFAYVPQEIAFPQHVTGRQMLWFMAAHAEAPLAIENLLAELRLGKFIDVPVRHLSGGQKRLLSIAAAFVRGTRFVVLDEPTVGLDLEVRRRLFLYWREFVARGGTLFMTTHHLHEAEELASRVIVLNQGRVVHTGSPAEIKRDYGLRRISFRCEQPPPAAVGASLCPLTGHWRIESREAEVPLRELVLWGGARDIEVSPLPLEDVLRQVVRQEEPKAWV